MNGKRITFAIGFSKLFEYEFLYSSEGILLREHFDKLSGDFISKECVL